VQILQCFSLAKLSRFLPLADVMASRETSDTDGSEAEMAPGCPCTCCCGRTVLRVCRPGDHPWQGSDIVPTTLLAR